MADFCYHILFSLQSAFFSALSSLKGDRYPHAPDHYPSVDRCLLRADQNLQQTETEKKRGG